MSRYKRLNAPAFFSYADNNPYSLKREGFQQIEPVFNRNGWYYDRTTKESWYEFGGKAWASESGQFLYELALLNTPWLKDEEIESIKTLKLYGNCPRVLLEMLWRHQDNVDLRNLRRDYKLHRCFSVSRQ